MKNLNFDIVNNKILNLDLYGISYVGTYTSQINELKIIGNKDINNNRFICSIHNSIKLSIE